MARLGTLRSALLACTLAVAAPAMAENVSNPVPAAALLGSGPYKAAMEVDPGLATHTIYHPANLAAVRGKMPVVVWGNGACANEGNRFRWFLSELASHGYLVIAIGPMGPPGTEIWRPAPAQPAPAAGGPPAQLPPPRSHSVQLIQAIDWALAENARKGGRFEGRLEASKIAAAGMSCGGAQAIEASADPRVTTTLVMNSGLFPEPTGMGGGKVLSKEDLKLFHAPVAYISGDESDIAYVNANDDFGRVSVPALRAWRKGTGHGGTYGEADGGDFGKVTVAWLDWRLKGDAAAGRMFLGPACGLCSNPQWVVKQKNLK